MTTQTTGVPGLAEWVRESADSLAGALGTLSAAVRQADGHHVDLGPGTAEKRVTAREAAEAADAARAALGALSEKLTALAEAWSTDDR